MRRITQQGASHSKVDVDARPRARVRLIEKSLKEVMQHPAAGREEVRQPLSPKTHGPRLGRTGCVWGQACMQEGGNRIKAGARGALLLQGEGLREGKKRVHPAILN